jgi:hypothetical protein
VNQNYNDLTRCKCGEVILSGKVRDYYTHIMEKHPEATITGVRCHLCQKVIPYGLTNCHMFMEHNVKSASGTESRQEMMNDYMVLNKMKEKRILIIDQSR